MLVNAAFTAVVLGFAGIAILGHMLVLQACLRREPRKPAPPQAASQDQANVASAGAKAA